jgi:hypothetical protein
MSLFEEFMEMFSEDADSVHLLGKDDEPPKLSDYETIQYEDYDEWFEDTQQKFPNGAIVHSSVFDDVIAEIFYDYADDSPKLGEFNLTLGSGWLYEESVLEYFEAIPCQN